MLQYIISIVVFQFLFLAVYEIFLKRETFFQLNRAYLLITSMISVVLPFIKIERFKSVIPKEYVIALPEIVLGNSKQGTQIGATETQAVEATGLYWNWELIYYFGVVIAITIFLVKVYKVLRLLNLKATYSNNIKLVKLPKGKQAFSFFNYVFLGGSIDTLETQHIIKHELVHIKQKHTWDLLYFELLRIVCWFNPFIYIYQNRISTLHEFIADAEVSKNQGKKEYYQSLLSQVFNTNTISFINPFFKKSLIKKRIVMLQKSKSRKVQLFKYALLIPVVLGMLMYVSCSDNTIDSEIAKEETILEQIEKLKLKAEENGGLTEEEKDEILKLWVQSTIDKKQETRIKTGLGQNEKGSLTDGGEELDVVEVPFSVIEKIPVFSGCDSNVSNDSQKECFNEKIAQFVGRNFNTQLGKELGLTGIQKIYVLFKIGIDGKIFDVKARAPHPDLEAEAVRVVNMLPEFTPGIQKGKKVVVPYSLPITFSVQ